MLSLFLIGLGLFTFAFLGVEAAFQSGAVYNAIAGDRLERQATWPWLVLAAMAVVEGTFLAVTSDRDSDESRPGMH